MKNKYYRGNNSQTIPYTYLVRFKETGQVYYGARFCKGANPDKFFIDYFTSSKLIHEIIKSHGINSLEYEIRKTFNSIDDCIKWENKVLRRIKAQSNPMFINKDSHLKIHSNTNKVFITNTITNETIRIKHTDPIPLGWIRAGVKNGKGNGCGVWAYSVETNESGMFVDENCIPCGWIRGRPSSHSNSKTIKAKNRKWYTDGQTNILLQIQEEIPLGFVLGRTKSEQEKINNTNANKLMGDTLIWITDGNTVKKHKKDEPLPYGFINGRNFHKARDNTNWKYIECYDVYIADDCIIKSKFNTKLKLNRNTKGLSINLYGKVVYLHQLLASLYLGYDETIHNIIHCNGNVYDNSVENLAVVSNVKVVIEESAIQKKLKYINNSKLSNEQVREIYMMLKTNNVTNISKILDIPRGTITAIKLKKSWTHITDELD